MVDDIENRSLLRIAAATENRQDYLVMRTDRRGSGFFVSLRFTALSSFAFATAFALLGIFTSPSGSFITCKSCSKLYVIFLI